MAVGKLDYGCHLLRAAGQNHQIGNRYIKRFRIAFVDGQIYWVAQYMALANNRL
jgi:hypothetical protein